MPYIGRTPVPVPIDASDIPDDSITAAKIVDGAIVAADIADNAVTDAKIADATIVNLKSGRKNLFINGGFDVWQRGTSATHQLSYLADRWYNATNETQSRQTFTVGQTDVDHFPTYYRRGTTGSTEWYELRQKVEDVGLTGGREVTLSYWMKGSSTFTNAPFRVQNFGSGGSSEVNAALSTASITTSWARYTHTFTLPSISGKTVGAGSYMQINLIRANVNNITIDVANCQLEFGDTATDFEHRSYGEELALCQRYYWRIGSTVASPYARYGLGYAPSTTLVRLSIQNEFRDIPSIYYSGNFAVQPGTGGTVTFSVLSNGSTSNSVTVNCNVSSVSLGDCVSVHTNNDTDAYLALDAEL